MNPWLAGCLLVAGAASAMTPPALLWEREYFTDQFCTFFRAIQTWDGGFVVALACQDDWPVIKLDEDGDIEWHVTESYPTQGSAWIENLPDSGFIATGSVKITSGSSVATNLLRIDKEGNLLWSRIYNLSTTGPDFAWCVTPLPDGGFAVCGEYDEYDAFVMRTDADGDSLWTRVFDYGHLCKAYRILYWDDGLTVFVAAYASYGPLILRYSLDGELLWAQDYTGEFYGMDGVWGGDFCLASDGGYLIASTFISEIGQTDWEGELLWHQPLPGDPVNCGLSLNPTMDGGYIFSGWCGMWLEPQSPMHSAAVDTGWTKDGWLVKLDAEGTADWFIDHEMGHHNIFYSACQLQGGGYIVAGQSDIYGYLLRYAPETGIEAGAEPSPSAALGEPSPNPSPRDFSISYALPEGMEVDLAVYDLSGRRVGGLFTGTAEPGSHQVLWDPGDAPSGCYLVVLRTEEGTETRHCVLMR